MKTRINSLFETSVQRFVVNTPLGKVIVIPGSSDRVFVDLGEKGNPSEAAIEYRGKQYRGDIKLNRNEKDGSLTLDVRAINMIDPIEQNDNKKFSLNGNATPVARKAIIGTVMAAVEKWSKANPQFFTNADKVNLESKIERLVNEKESLIKKIAEVDTELASLKKQLSRYK